MIASSTSWSVDMTAVKSAREIRSARTAVLAATVLAATVAVWGTSETSEISPRKAPASRSATSTWLPRTRMPMDTRPASTT
jgi:hypothetical protein